MTIPEAEKLRSEQICYKFLSKVLVKLLELNL